jgi:hypothetical protein
MKHYEIKISFQTYRDLTAEELSNLETALTLQIEEPTNSDQEDEDYETKLVGYSVEQSDVDPKCCKHGFDKDCDCCNAVCPDCQDDDYYLSQREFYKEDKKA